MRQDLVRKTGGKLSFGRCQDKRESNIKMTIEKLSDVKQIHLG
jgi:hypothetical protein